MGTTATPAELKQFEGNANTSAESLSGGLKKLMTDLTLLSSQWVGRAGTQFSQTSVIVEQENTKLNSALHGIATDMGSVSVTYVEGDAAQAQTVQAVDGQISGVTSALRGM